MYQSLYGSSLCHVCQYEVRMCNSKYNYEVSYVSGYCKIICSLTNVATSHESTNHKNLNQFYIKIHNYKRQLLITTILYPVKMTWYNSCKHTGSYG